MQYEQACVFRSWHEKENAISSFLMNVDVFKGCSALHHIMAISRMSKTAPNPYTPAIPTTRQMCKFLHDQYEVPRPRNQCIGSGLIDSSSGSGHSNLG